MRRGRSDIEGFWQTLGWPAASVDFCESNYESSRYVAEPINALSALPYLYFGWYGASAIRGGDAWEQTAFRLAFRCLFLIGVGTFALHATLTAPAQALDEIPMLLLSLDLMFLMSQVNAGATPVLSPRGSSADGSQRRRGCYAVRGGDSRRRRGVLRRPWRRVAATPRRATTSVAATPRVPRG